MATAWGLPERLAAGIADHHSADASVVTAVTSELEDLERPEAFIAAASELEIDSEQAKRLLETAVAEADEIVSLFKL